MRWRMLWMVSIFGLLAISYTSSATSSVVYDDVRRALAQQVGAGTASNVWMADDRTRFYVATAFGIDEVALPQMTSPRSLLPSQFQFDEFAATAIARTENGELIAAGTAEGEVLLWIDWNLTTIATQDGALSANIAVEPLSLASGQPGSVSALAFAADGEYLLAGTDAGHVFALDLLTGVVAEIASYDAALLSLEFVDDTSHIVGVSTAGDVLLVDGTTAEFLREETIHLDPDERVTCVAPTGEAPEIVVGTSLGRVLKCRIDEGIAAEELFLMDKEIASLDYSASTQEWAMVLQQSASWFRTILVRADSSEDPVVVSDCYCEVFPLARFDGSGTMFYVWEDGAFLKWDCASEEAVYVRHDHMGDVADLAFTHDGSGLAVTAGDGWVRLWDWRSDRVTHAKALDYPGYERVACSPTADLLAYSDSSSLRFWNTATGDVSENRLWQPGGWSSSIADLRFRPDGRRVAVGHSSSFVSLWSVRTGLNIRWIPPEGMERTSSYFEEYTPNTASSTSSFSYSPNGRQFAVGYRDGVIRLLRASDGRETGRLSEHRDSVTDLCFAPSGRWLASVSRDRRLLIWELDAAAPRIEIDIGRAGNGVAVSADGEWIFVTTSRSLAVYSAEDGSLLRAEEFEWYPSILLCTAMALSPDGTHLATGHTEGLVFVWSVDKLLSD